jgi:hypothetical protein
MTQGIRDYANARFAKFLPQFRAGELTGTEFRKKVITGTETKFGISLASAATHYNHALKMTRLADPKAVEGLGRPEDKKGGRPVLNPVTVVNTRSGKVVVEGISKGAADILIAKAGVLKSGDNKLSIQAVEADAAA